MSASAWPESHTTTLTMSILKELSRHCQNAGIRYSVLGGAACLALGSSRGTDDIDMVVDCGNNYGVDDVFTKMKHLANQSSDFTLADSYLGVLELTYKDFRIECFDPTAWPMRPQYMRFLEDDGFIQVHGVNIVTPQLLLREKLITQGQRSGMKLDLTVDDQTLPKAARNGLAIFLQGMQDARELVEQVIKH